MMDKVIVYTGQNGILSVCIPAPEGRLKDETEDKWLQRVIARSVPSDAKDVHVIPRSQLPQDRYFRNAWVLKSGKALVDMPRARDEHRRRIRMARAKQLRAMDVEHLRAMELGDGRDLARVADAKKKLRDAPAHPDIESAKTLDELKAVWPL